MSIATTVYRNRYSYVSLLKWPTRGSSIIRCTVVRGHVRYVCVMCTYNHGVGRYTVGGDHPSGLQVRTIVFERVPDDRRSAQVRRGRVPRDRNRVFGNVDDGRHGRRGRKHGRIRRAVQTRARRFFYGQRRWPWGLATLRRRGARVHARIGYFEFCEKHEKHKLNTYGVHGGGFERKW